MDATPDDSANVVSLPVRPRPALGDLMLVEPPRTACSHYPGRFIVDKDAGKCTCRDCGEEVSPMYVLERLMHHESLWNRNRDAHHDEMARLSKRVRTKCDHCGQMTRISRR